MNTDRNLTPIDALARAGRALYGEQWQSPLGRTIDVSAETIRRWLTGHTPFTADHGALDDALMALRAEPGRLRRRASEIEEAAAKLEHFLVRARQGEAGPGDVEVRGEYYTVETDVGTGACLRGETREGRYERVREAVAAAMRVTLDRDVACRVLRVTEHDPVDIDGPFGREVVSETVTGEITIPTPLSYDNDPGLAHLHYSDDRTRLAIGYVYRELGLPMPERP